MVKPAGGLSLIELMVVVAILGIMLGFAAPNYAEWVATQRVRDTAADIHTSLMRARSEALSRGVSTSVCAVNGNLANGWSIPNPSLNTAGTALINPDTTDSADLTFKCSNLATITPDTLEVFIEQHGPVPNSIITITPNTVTNVTFSSNGRVATEVFITIVAVAGTNVGRCITVNTAGRPKTRAINKGDACT